MSINSIFNSIQSTITQREAAVKNAAQGDLSNHQNMLAMQMENNKYQASVTLQSNLVKSMHDLMSSIIRNIS